MFAFYLNIIICCIITIAGFIWWWWKQSRWRKQSGLKITYKPFIRAALTLLLLRYAGYIVVYLRLIALRTASENPINDPLLLAISDALLIFELAAWIILLRGDAYRNIGALATAIQMAPAWLIIISLDLAFSRQLRDPTWLPAVPGAVLDLLSWGLAAVAAHFRYRERSRSFILTTTTYAVLNIFAYQPALFNIPGPAPWIFYALATAKFFQFVTLWHLLLGDLTVPTVLPIRKILAKYWSLELLLAIVAALAHWLHFEYRPLATDGNPLFVTVVIAVSLLAISVGIQRLIKEFRSQSSHADH